MLPVKNIIREARGNKSQAEFSALLGKSQGLVSKYEKGIVNPPTDIIEKCMKILDMHNTNKKPDGIGTDFLAKRVRSELKSPKLDYVRQTIAMILDGVQATKL